MMATWTPRMEDTLRRLWAEKRLSMSEIGKRLGVSRGAVAGKLNRLKLCDGRAAIKWTAREDAILRREWLAGRTSGEISQMLDRSAQAIKIRARNRQIKPRGRGWQYRHRAA